MNTRATMGRPMMGLVSGLAATAVFTILHDLLISDIWFSFGPMLVAGSICGASLAWTHQLLFEPPTESSWIRFVAFQTALLLALGLVSVLVFDPIVPMAVVLAANEPPNELIGRALPLTVVFILCAAAATSLLWGRSPSRFGATLVTETLLIFFLGLNVSVLGLVEMSSDSPVVVAEFFGWIVLIMVIYGTAFIVLERTLRSRTKEGRSQ